MGDGVVMLLVVIVGIAAYIWERGREAEMERIVNEDVDPAVSGPFDFPAPDHEVHRLTGKVREVCLMRNVQGSAGGESGSKLSVSFSVFLIDINGATHDLATSRNWGELQSHAQELATALAVPFTDTSYGTFTRDEPESAEESGETV